LQQNARMYAFEKVSLTLTANVFNGQFLIRLIPNLISERIISQLCRKKRKRNENKPKQLIQSQGILMTKQYDVLAVINSLISGKSHGESWHK